ncbi:MAG: SDR family oxidoreductase [Fimbriimonadales bacterium]|nr:SDR family oxidoreductase [Fimbriimonadales bacterium]
MRRICVVTGASSGIGRECAIELSKRDVSVVLSGRNESRLEEAAKKCRGAGVIAKAVAGSIANPEYCQQLFDEAVEMMSTGGRAAGVAPEGEPVELCAIFAAGTASFGPTVEYPPLAWQNTIEANLTGLFFCCQSAIRAMLSSGGGRVVNVLSIAAKQPFPQSSAYVASKFGALGLTHSLANEYRKDGIFLTAFIPGSVDTPLWEGMDWTPERTDMLTATDVARAIVDIVTAETHGVYDEVVFMPKKGIL